MMLLVKLFRKSIAGNDNFQLLDWNLHAFAYVMNFRRLSPFRQKFAETQTRVTEFGLNIKWAHEEKLSIPPEKPIDIAGDDKALVVILKYVMGIGSIVALMILVFFELSWKKIFEKMCKHRKSGVQTTNACV